MVWYYILGNDLVIVLLTLIMVRIFFGRPIKMVELQALQTAVTNLSAAISKLSAAGLISATALTPLTTTVDSLTAQVTALLPPGA
jgi:hypothetical protein